MTVRNDKFSKASLTLYACGTIPVIWIALLLAPYVDGGLVALIRYGGAALNDPFHTVVSITKCSSTRQPGPMGSFRRNISL